MRHLIKSMRDGSTIKNKYPLSEHQSENHLNHDSTMNTLHLPTVLKAVFADVFLKLLPYHRELDVELEAFYRELEAEKRDCIRC